MDGNPVIKMKKSVVLICVFLALVLSISVVQAQSNETNESNESETSGSVEDMARSCVEGIVDDRGCSALGVEDKVFSLSSAGMCESELNDEAVNGECFGSNACTVKHTAQASLALENAGNDVSNYTNWIKSQNQTTSGLDWFLQIDSDSQTSCSIRDLDGNNYQASITSEGEVSLNNNQNCLSVSDNGYWLEVDSSCYDQEFEVSCQDSFSTSLLFSRQTSSTVYVTDEIQTSSGGGATVEEMQKSLCLGSGGCSYEDTLWGVLALEEMGENASEYYPYLEAYAEDNEDLLPESFLYQLTGDRNYRSELVLKQKADRYWRETSNRYYDTAVALMALTGEDLEAKSNAMDWLEGEQGSDGCWNSGSLRDTGFLIHSIWPESQGSQEPIGGGGDQGGQQDCESQGYSCVNDIECSEAGGDILNEFSCSSYGERCCTEEPQQKTCSELGGSVCSSSETCSGSTESGAAGLTSGETCCVGSCQPADDEDENLCSDNGGTCKSQCGSGESESSVYSCSTSGQVCCMQDLEGGGSGNSLWIILVILIVLVVLAIIFKDKVKQIYLRLKSKFGGSGKGSSGPQGRGKPPGHPPRGPPRGPGPKKRPPQQPPQKVIERRRGRNPPHPDKKKEIDDVLGKLKKIGK